MPAPNLQSAKILVIDDEPLMIEMIESVFRARGLGTVWSTSDPRQAVELFLEVQPDLVLLDLIMPHMDGLEVLHALRAREDNDVRVPILVVTADPRVQSRHAALGYDATDFLTKPFDPVELTLRASSLLETRFLHLQLAAQNKLLAEQLRERQRAEEALRETGSLLQSILDYSPSAIFVKDGDGRFLLVNQRVEELVGMPCAEIIGKTNHDLPIPRETADEASEHDRQVFETGAPIHVEEHLRRDGEIRTYLSVKFPLIGSQRGVYAVCGIATDITEQKLAEATLRESEHRYRHLVQTLPIGIHTCDAEGRITLYNKVAADLWGREPDLDRDRWCGAWRLYHPDGSTLAHADCPMAVALREGRSVRGQEIIVERPDGARFFVLPYPDPIRDASGAIVGAVNMLVDLTSRKEAESALTAARVEAERANRAKSEFLSRMSHELRTPLNAILGFAQVLELNALQGQEDACVTHILKAGRHLLALINEILDLSGIEAGRITFSIEPVRVLEVIRECIDLIRPHAVAGQLRLVAPEQDSQDSYVLADRQRLKQVVLNLLAVAEKYNREGGSVTVSWEDAPSEGLRIIVHDTGHGIEPENLERLFVPFDRLGAEGNGLGLALSKRLIDAMGGEIGAESGVGEGSTYWIKLPRAHYPLERLGEPAGTAAAPPTPASGTVLYIEDNLSNLRLIEHLLQHRPQIKLLVAMQGRLGLDLAREHHPDLVLLDLHLPDMMGDEVLTRLKGDPATREIPVAIFAADATPDRETRLRAAGANEFLTKPIDFPPLLRLIEKTLGSRADG